MKCYSLLLLLILYTCFIQAGAVLEQSEQGITTLHGDTRLDTANEGQIKEGQKVEQKPQPEQAPKSETPQEPNLDQGPVPVAVHQESGAPRPEGEKTVQEPLQQPTELPTPFPSGPVLEKPTEAPVSSEPVQQPAESLTPISSEPVQSPQPLVSPEQTESKPVPPLNIPMKTEEQVEKQQAIIAPPIVPDVVPELTEQEIEREMLPDTQIANIDTTTLAEPQGNWLFKRMWWERSLETYQKLKDLVDKIMDRRVEFFKQRSALDKDLFDTFYMELGMGLAEFSTIVQDLMDRLEKEQPQEEVMSQNRQTLLDSLRLEKATIEQVKKNIDGLKQVDNAIEDSLGIVIETINAVRRYERDGWDFFKEIGQLLNEKKARELFYRLDVAYQNVKQLSNYLEQSFASYFSALETRARSTVAQLHDQMNILKEKGIDLRTRVALLDQPEEVPEQVLSVEQGQEEEEERVKKPTSWWRTIIDTVKSYF